MAKNPVFQTEIRSNQADAYTLHNLSPATVYKVQVKIFIVDIYANMNTKPRGSKANPVMEEKSDAVVFKIVESQELMFNTA